MSFAAICSLPAPLFLVGLFWLPALLRSHLALLRESWGAATAIDAPFRLRLRYALVRARAVAVVAVVFWGVLGYVVLALTSCGAVLRWPWA